MAGEINYWLCRSTLKVHFNTIAKVIWHSPCHFLSLCFSCHHTRIFPFPARTVPLQSRAAWLCFSPAELIKSVFIYSLQRCLTSLNINWRPLSWTEPKTTSMFHSDESQMAFLAGTLTETWHDQTWFLKDIKALWTGGADGKVLTSTV